MAMISAEILTMVEEEHRDRLIAANEAAMRLRRILA